jgi:uncharacterized protein YcbX
VPSTVTALRRYPVKAMGGEELSTVDLDARGIVGDRWFAVTDGDGRLASGKDTRRFRRRDAVFDYAARTVDGRVRIGTVEPGGPEWAVDDPALAAELSATIGVPVTVQPERETPHQDAAGLSLVGSATLRWCAERFDDVGDPRRLRANIVVSTDDPFVEESWVGQQVDIGTATIVVTERVVRCRTIDVAQDGVVPRGRWLAGLAADRDVRVAVYAEVVSPGRIRTGDALTVRST